MEPFFQGKDNKVPAQIKKDATNSQGKETLESGLGGWFCPPSKKIKPLIWE